MTRLFCVLLSFLFLCTAAFAQSATVRGVVTDKNGKPVRGAAVALRARGADRKTTQTDDEGRFQFENVEVGAWEIRATAAELMPVEYELSVRGEQPVNVDLVMPDRYTVEQKVEVVATKLAEDPADVPGAIQVFGGDELSARGARDLPTALAQATGVTIAPGGDGGPAGSVPEFWGLKEFDAFLLAVDGVPWGGAFNPALTSLTMSDVERVEVMRGPAPVSYGATSFVGVINVVRQPADSTESTLTLYGGSWASGGGSFSFPVPIHDEWKSRLTLEGERQGFEDDRTSFARGHGLWRLERKWNPETRFWFNSDINWLDQSPASPRVRGGAVLVSPVDANYNPADAFLNDHRFTFMTGFDRPWGQEWHWYTTASVSHARQDFFRGFLLDFVPPPDNAHGFREKLNLTDIYFDTHWTRRYPRGVTFVFGTDYLHGSGRAQGADFDYDVPLTGEAVNILSPADLDFHIDDDRDFIGPYAQVEWSPFERLRIDVGGRLNITRERKTVNDQGAAELESGSQANVRGGANVGAIFTAWQSGQDDLHLFATYRDTFKPAAIDFGIGEDEGEGKFILDPETARSVEGGMKARFFDRRVELEASAFLMNFENLVMPVDNGGVPALINGGKSRFQGFETGGAYYFRSDLIARASYSYHDAHFTDFLQDFGSGNQQLGGNRLEMSANHLASFGLMYAPVKGFLGGVSVNYTGDRFLNKRNTALADGFATFDLSAGYRTRKWELRVDARNLSDARDPVAESELGDAQYYLMTPRRVDATFRIHF